MDENPAPDRTASDPSPPEGRASAAPNTHLSKELQDLLQGLEGADITIGGLLEHIGDRGFGLLLLVLALPAALPIPAPGYATPFGFLMVILGAQMLLGRKSPTIPGIFARRTVGHGILAFSIRNGHLPLRVVEFLIRPRLRAISRNRGFRAAVGVIIMAMAAFMSLPIPLTNTAPSFVIFVLAAGLLEEDGLTLLAGIILAPVAACIALGALYVAVTMGPDAVETTLKPMIKGLLGG